MKTSHIPVGCQGWAHRAAQRSSPPGPVGTEPSSPGRGWSCQTRQINISGARASLSTLKSGMELIERSREKKKKKVKSALDQFSHLKESWEKTFLSTQIS